MTDWTGDAWGIRNAALLIAEIDRELAERAATDRALVDKGRLDPREADHRALVVGDIRADLRFAFAPLREGEWLNWCERTDPAPAATWEDKVAWINRELELRLEHYPKLVGKGRLTREDADRRIAAIAELRRLYWERMFMWVPPEGPGRDYLDALRAAAIAGNGSVAIAPLMKGEGRRVYQEHVRRHLAAVASEQAEQGELAA
jgi:hypothetical protein